MISTFKKIVSERKRSRKRIMCLTRVSAGVIIKGRKVQRATVLRMRSLTFDKVSYFECPSSLS